MGLFHFLFGKSEIIWTLDVYIEAICSVFQGREPNHEDAGKKIRKWGEEILETYGLVGIQHARRAVALSDDKEDLTGILRREWSGFPGWKA
ncbi:MAG: hypothetical protein ACYTFG_15520 [Planctomycetota bacterium]|jgi:hypothetical protein